MDEIRFVDALTGATVVYDSTTGNLAVGHDGDGVPACKSIFFPGCSMINYAMPLVAAVQSTLEQHGEVDGISLLCCGKILSYEPNGDEIRASFEDQLRDHLAETSIERIVCACPNCMLALRNALAADDRTAHIQLTTLPQLLVKLGYRIDPKTTARIIKDDEDASVLLCVHDSCPDREFGEYAEGLRDILPSDMWIDPEHARNRSICCGSRPRAAGNIKGADKCADINGREALAVSADALVTACMSCTFQLNTAQQHLRAIHFLELLYDWPIPWRVAPPWMRVRFLFDDVMGATELDEESARTFESLEADAGAGVELDAQQVADAVAATDVALSNTNTKEVSL